MSENERRTKYSTSLYLECRLERKSRVYLCGMKAYEKAEALQGRFENAVETGRIWIETRFLISVDLRAKEDRSEAVGSPW